MRDRDVEQDAVLGGRLDAEAVEDVRRELGEREDVVGRRHERLRKTRSPRGTGSARDAGRRARLMPRGESITTARRFDRGTPVLSIRSSRCTTPNRTGCVSRGTSALNRIVARRRTDGLSNGSRWKVGRAGDAVDDARAAYMMQRRRGSAHCGVCRKPPVMRAPRGRARGRAAHRAPSFLANFGVF